MVIGALVRGTAVPVAGAPPPRRPELDVLPPLVELPLLLDPELDVDDTEDDGAGDDDADEDGDAGTAVPTVVVPADAVCWALAPAGIRATTPVTTAAAR
ncbi:MAG TPA: hypothetical protein VLV86_17065 [Vicinamibacterales bacterium]|nr:hypothetical protein [Vicinamibacterales bacterium]